MPDKVHRPVSLRTVREYNRRLQRAMRLISVQVTADIREAINQMQIYSISQLPVLDGDRLVGSLDERALLERLSAAPLNLRGCVALYMQPPLPALDEDAAAAEVLALLRQGVAGVVVTRAGVPVGILTAADLIAFKVYGGQLEYEI
jgi:predicted transcriptional regulator